MAQLQIKRWYGQLTDVRYDTEWWIRKCLKVDEIYNWSIISMIVWMNRANHAECQSGRQFPRTVRKFVTFTTPNEPFPRYSSTLHGSNTWSHIRKQLKKILGLMPCSVLLLYQCFGWDWCLCPQGIQLPYRFWDPHCRLLDKHYGYSSGGIFHE